MKIKDLNTLRWAIRSIPSIGEYFATAEMSGVVDVALVTDGFVSPISKNIVLEVKVGTFRMYSKSTEVIFRIRYLDIDFIMDSYRYADEKQIERFKKLQADELKPLSKRIRKKKEKMKDVPVCPPE